MSETKKVFYIVELGGYPLLTNELAAEGITVQIERKMRKAIATLKSDKPNVIVAEFNHQTQFRDRVSNLESLLACRQGHCPDSKMIVLLANEDAIYFKKVEDQYPIDKALVFPLNEKMLLDAIVELTK